MQIARAFRTIVSMMRARRLHPSMEELEAFEREQLPELLGRLSTVFHWDFPTCALRVIFHLESSFKASAIRKIVESAMNSATTIIIVLQAEPSTHARRTLEDGSSKAHVQVFDLKSLQFDISKHELVPLHEPVRDEREIRRIMDEYEIRNKSQFQGIPVNDAQARFLALKPGELVRITRFSPSAGQTTVYRCCTTRA